LNRSVEIASQHVRSLERLTRALDLAAQRRAVVVVAAGNQGVVGSSPLAYDVLVDALRPLPRPTDIDVVVIAQ
jgi:precorrin-3B methylase